MLIMSNEILLVQAASAQNSLSKLPNSSQVINALLKLEKDSKQEQKKLFSSKFSWSLELAFNYRNKEN